MEDIGRREFVMMAAATFSLQVATSGSSAFAKASGASDELAGITLSEASRRLRSKETTSTQLTQACLDRIEIYNPKINAFITVMRRTPLCRRRNWTAKRKPGKFRGRVAWHSHRAEGQYRYRRNAHHRGQRSL